jgi:hypothetical protein
VAARFVGFAIRAAPLVAIFIAVEALLSANVISFTEPLNVVGTITLPLLGGLFPMLLLVASRKRGERIPGRVIGALGWRVTALLIGALYLASLIAFGLWIWHEPLERLAALATAGAMIALALVTWRRGAFAPRTVVEYRVEAGPPEYGVLSLLSAGRPLSAQISLGETTGNRTLTAAEIVINAPNRLRTISVALPARAGRELELWIHSIAADGSSLPAASHVELAGVGDVQAIRIGGRTDTPLIVSGAGEAAVLTISLSGVPAQS